MCGSREDRRPRPSPAAKAAFAADSGRQIHGQNRALRAVDRHGVVRALSHEAAGRVCVSFPVAAGDGIVVHHRVHVAAADQKAEPGLAQDGDGIGIFPVRLRDDADLVAVGLQNTRDDRVPERRMVDIGVLAAQRSAVSSLGEEVAQRKPFERVFSGLFRKQKGRGPFEIPGVPDLHCLSNGAIFYGFWRHSLSGL